ncbi:MAG: 50S ribosomal protein L17 [Proteobacteria bacterium]|nr:50S ribosomal protein L17 [Pseudomonadota bacterium]
MRHQRKTRTLGRNTSHRIAMIKNMVVSLIKNGRIETTEARAREARRFAEKMVTLGKRGDLHSRRLAFAFLRDDDALTKLFSEIAPKFNNRKGGYTRILKLGNRLGDSAPVALLEWIDYVVPEKEEKEQ